MYVCHLCLVDLRTIFLSIWYVASFLASQLVIPYPQNIPKETLTLK